MMVEVRCCCQPKKLLGYVEVPEDAVRSGNTYMFPVRAVVEHLIPNDSLAVIKTEVVNLPIAELFTNGGRRLAFKSEETPIETLRRIPGFVEATP